MNSGKIFGVILIIIIIVGAIVGYLILQDKIQNPFVKFEKLKTNAQSQDENTNNNTGIKTVNDEKNGQSENASTSDSVKEIKSGKIQENDNFNTYTNTEFDLAFNFPKTAQAIDLTPRTNELGRINIYEKDAGITLMDTIVHIYDIEADSQIEQIKENTKNSQTETIGKNEYKKYQDEQSNTIFYVLENDDYYLVVEIKDVTYPLDQPTPDPYYDILESINMSWTQEGMLG